jgi:glucose-1-phosphate thymidylyltransferase
VTQTLVSKAVILARGLGTRMRREDGSARLSGDQAAAAEAGSKALMPVGSRPFLDYVLSALADAGLTEACLVVGPGPHPLRDRYNKDIVPRRLRIAFAVQERPLGTADALAAAESFTGGEEFLALNSDNYYPLSAYAALRALEGPGFPAFRRRTLTGEGLIPAERVGQFALVLLDGDGNLQRIVEKPDAAARAALHDESLVSMNCWRFSPAIFRACRSIPLSPRGELELPQAVQYAVTRLGERLRAVPCEEPVLDLSTRADVSAVAERLRNIPVRL